MEQVPPQIEQAEAALGECMARATGWDASCDRSAAHLAQTMVESGMPRQEMLRRLSALGLSKRATRRLRSNAERVVQDRQLAKENEQLAGASPLCPHCLQPISPTDHFCPKCCGPVSVHASIDPLGQVYSAGRAYRQAVSGSPRLVVLVAMWLIFGPSLLLMFLLAYLNLRVLGAFGPQDQPGLIPREGIVVPSDGFVLDLLKLVLLCGMIALSSAILWKMTSRWVSSRRRGA